MGGLDCDRICVYVPRSAKNHEYHFAQWLIPLDCAYSNGNNGGGKSSTVVTKSCGDGNNDDYDRTIGNINHIRGDGNKIIKICAKFTAVE